MYMRTLLLLLVLAVGCTPALTPKAIPDQTPTVGPTSTPSSISTLELPTPTPEDTLVHEVGSLIALTNQRLDGNRLVGGFGGMPAEPLDIQLSGKPLWLVAAPVQDSSVWVVALESGHAASTSSCWKPGRAAFTLSRCICLY